MDDTCSLFSNEREALLFLARLNDNHPLLKFTVDKEIDGVLPFLVVQVTRHEHSFETTAYRKSMFTALYTRWDNHATNGQKLALIKPFATRTKWICYEDHLGDEIRHL